MDKGNSIVKVISIPSKKDLKNHYEMISPYWKKKGMRVIGFKRCNRCGNISEYTELIRGRKKGG